MPSIAAILTLALPAAAADGVRALERLPLPAAAGSVAIRVEALQSRVIATASRGSGPLAGALRALGSTICPRVEESRGEVVLSCRTPRLAAGIVAMGKATALELRELAGLPVTGEDGFPLLPLDLEGLGLPPCPGQSPAARGECLLAGGDRDAARRAFSAAEGPEARGLAALRLGDLALVLDGNLPGAEALWAQVAEEPWKRLAAARPCEVSSCAAGDRAEAAFRTDGLPAPLALDAAIRGARVLAFRGRPAEAAARLRAVPGAGETASLLFRRMLLAALRGSSPPQADGALSLYLPLPDRETGPLALELGLAAAARAQAVGAPVFAANLLASVAGLVPERELGAHLLGAAELYLAGGDAVRAGVVMEYARVHVGKKAAGGPRWAAVARAVQPRRRAPLGAEDGPGPDRTRAELAAATAALAKARTAGGTP